MKKKLLLVFCLAIAICAIFAISASAKTVTTLDGKTLTVTTYPGDEPTRTVISISTDDVVVFNDGFVCPTGYIYKDSGANISDGDGDARIKNALDFSYLEEKTGKLYSVNDIVEIDIPEGVTHITKRAFQNLTTVKKVTFPKTVTSISAATFQNATGLEECVFEHGENDNLTSLPGYMFYGCSNLKAFSMPDCVTSISDIACFTRCGKMTAVYLSKNLTVMKSGGGGSRTGIFDDCYKMYFVSSPFTTSDTAPEKPTVYYYPSGLTDISGNQSAYRSCESMNQVLVLGTGITSISNNCFFQNAPAGTVIVFLGDMTSINTQYWGNTTKIIFANPNDKSSADIASYTNSRSALFCASETDKTKHLESPRHSEITPATCYSNKAGIVRCFCNLEIDRGEFENTMLTTHDYVDDFDCTTANYCKNFGEGKCDKLLVADAEAHIEAHDVIFANGFTSAGVHNTYCSNATCKALDEVENLSAMFVHEGYSYKSRTYGGIDTKFRINTDAMKLYEKYEGEIHFGIMIANAAHFANVDVFIKDGKLTSTNSEGKNSGVIVEMTSREYDYFNCYIDGFKLDDPDHIALGLIIAGYVYGEDPTDITYIQKDYKTDDDQTTLEIPYVATITKDKEVKIVNIVAVRDFEPLKETQQ